jgi:predicted nucleotidyltransferase
MLNHNEIRNAVSAVAPKYGIESVYLFGSYARGDATESSDFDLRIVGGNIRSLLDLIGLRLELEEVLGKPVDAVMADSMKDSFYRLIKDEEVQIYGKI